MENSSRAYAAACLATPYVSAEQFLQFRNSLRLTQVEFAAVYGIPVETIEQWEREGSPRGTADTTLCLEQSRYFGDPATV